MAGGSPARGCIAAFDAPMALVARRLPAPDRRPLRARGKRYPRRLLENLERQIEATVGEGARLLTGGRRLDRPGHYFAPTVLGDVRPGMTAFAEETFGPVAALVRAADEDEAIELANDTPYGLAASVWTGDPQRGLEAGRRLRSGVLFVNGVVASDPRLPFGGTRRS